MGRDLGRTYRKFNKKKLRKFGIFVNPQKIKIGLTEIEYVGHTIDRYGEKFSQKKQEQVLNFKTVLWRNHIENGDIKVEYLHTKSMIADYLTKPLVGELFYKLRDLLLGYTTL